MITERVQTGRRGPLAVALIVLVLVALLAWKPWAGPVEPLPSPTTVAVRPSAAPTPGPTLSTLPTDSATAPATSTPASPTPSPQVLVIDVVTLTTASRAFVDCRYGDMDGGGSALASLRVEPPRVWLQSGAISEGVRRVAWRAALEVNRLETLFSADWQPVEQSRRQFAPDLASRPLAFRQVPIDYTQLPTDPTLVVRVVFVVEWFGRHGVELGSRRVVATTYAHGDIGPVLPEGCHTLN